MNEREEYLSKVLNENGIPADENVVKSLCKYFDLLIKKNEVMNLTAITDFNEACVKHFADSLSICKLYDLSDKKVIDIGTGAGFPGIPLKILYPSCKITLVDSLNKRIDFLNEVIDELELKGITAIHARAEEIARKDEYREQFDYAVSRAVANLSSLCEFCIPFVKVGGKFVAYKGSKAEEELNALGNCSSLLGGDSPVKKDYQLSDTDFGRSFIIVNKVKSTANKYPRGGGKPLKDPLK